MKPLLLIVVAASLAYGNTPLTSAYVGIDYLSMDNSVTSSYIACAAGCGGEFGGTISLIGAASSYTPDATGISTGFWCVDSQEDFSFGNAGYAAVVPLSDITPSSTDVRYANVGTAGNPGWTWTTGALSGANVQSAQVRYELAAWLVQQYSGFADTIASGPVDDAIQRAIWDITSNNTAGIDPTSPSYAPFATNLTTPDQGDAYWVQQAVNCYNNSSSCSPLDNWALVSWVADPSDDSLVPGQNRQTFLVQLSGVGTFTHNSNPTPEPSFYGALGVGMLGLILSAWRRKKKNQNHTLAA